jgi:adenylate cyclase
MIIKNEEHFKEFLLEYSQEESQVKRREIEQEIWSLYGEKKAVLIIDMTGFTVLTERWGSVHYLSMITRMQRVTKPIIEQYNGEVVKFEADNCFAIFDNVEESINASIELNKALEIENQKTPDKFDIKIGCGIAYGNILLLENEDIYGNAVNIASKLGEDIAAIGEILVTYKAMKNITINETFKYTPIKHTISKVDILGFSITY